MLDYYAIYRKQLRNPQLRPKHTMRLQAGCGSACCCGWHAAEVRHRSAGHFDQWCVLILSGDLFMSRDNNTLVKWLT